MEPETRTTHDPAYGAHHGGNGMSPSAPEHTPSPGSSWVGRIVILLVLGGLVAWGAVRVKESLAVKKTEEEARAAAAEEAKKDISAKPAEVVSGKAEQWTPRVPLDGTLQPARDTDLGFKASGRLSSIRVKMGDCVAQGATLATLESHEAQAQVQAAEAGLRAAEAQLALASDTAQRTGTLLGKGAASQQMGVQTDQQHSLAQAQRDSARAQLDLARANLKNHVLSAPFAGCVTRVPAGTGAIVAPGAPLFHLQDTSALRLAGTLGEKDAELVKVGAPVELTLDGKPVRGTLTALLGSVDGATRRVPVEAEIKNPDRSLRGGSFVRAEVVGTAAIAVLRLPGSTLRPGSQDELMAVKPLGEGKGRLAVRHVVFTPAADGTLLVRAGLTAEEGVLLSPIAESTDGQTVLVASAPSIHEAPAGKAKEATR